MNLAPAFQQGLERCRHYGAVGPMSVVWTDQNDKPLLPGTLLEFYAPDWADDDLALVMSAYYKASSEKNTVTLYHLIMFGDGHVEEWQHNLLKVSGRVLRVAANAQQLKDELLIRREELCAKAGITRKFLIERHDTKQ